MTLTKLCVMCAWAFAIEFAIALGIVWVWKELR